MSTLSLSNKLPQTLQKFLDRQIEEGGFVDEAAYFSALLEAEKLRSEEPVDKKTIEILAKRMLDIKDNKTSFFTIDQLDKRLKKIIDKTGE